MAIPFQAKNNSQTVDFSQKKLVEQIRKHFGSLSDTRTGSNISYQLSDAALSAFAVFFMQNPSFLAQQKSVEKSHGKSNIQTLFGAHKIPCDNQIRNLLDTVPPEEIYPIFNFIFKGLQDTGYLKLFASVNHSLRVAMDGVEYFSSQKIHCKKCSTQTLKNAQTHYSHKAITPVIVSVKKNQVIPLAPEFILPQDGCEKQDCELTASTRWMTREKSLFTDQPITILGDDLYSHQPFCEQILAKNWHFILVCKPDSHQTLYEWLDDFERLGKNNHLHANKMEWSSAYYH